MCTRHEWPTPSLAGSYFLPTNTRVWWQRVYQIKNYHVTSRTANKGKAFIFSTHVYMLHLFDMKNYQLILFIKDTVESEFRKYIKITWKAYFCKNLTESFSKSLQIVLYCRHCALSYAVFADFNYVYLRVRSSVLREWRKTLLCLQSKHTLM